MYVGTGVQLIGMALVTMVFAALGFLSPANRGGLMTAMLLLFVFMGLLGGYASARLYKVGRSLMSHSGIRSASSTATCVGGPGICTLQAGQQVHHSDDQAISTIGTRMLQRVTWGPGCGF